MKKIAYFFFLVFLLVSCMKDLAGVQEPGGLDFRLSLESFSQTSTKAGEPVELKGGDTKLYLVPEVREWPSVSTKGTVVTDASSIDGFFLFGYRYDDSHEWTGAEEERNLYNMEYVSRRNGRYVIDHPKLWSTAAKQRFVAIASSMEGDITSQGGGVTSGNNCMIDFTDCVDAPGYPSFDYAVACGDAVSSQEDLLYAVSSELEYTQGGSGVVNLSFSHALTAVKFSVEDFGVPAVIKNVSIRGVERAGYFSLYDSSWDPYGYIESSWYYSASLDDDSDGVSVGRTGESVLTDGSATFLMIPQTCPQGSEVQIEFVHDGKLYALYADLEGQEWEMGKEIEYKLSLTGGTYHLDVSAPEAFTQKGVSETISELFKVKSYLKYAGGVKEALPWSVYGYSEDGGTTWTDERPTWLTALTESGSGNYESGDAVSGTVVADRDSYEALVRLQIDEHTSTYVDVLVEKQGEEPLTFSIVTGGDILWKSRNVSYPATIKYKKNEGDWIEIESSVSGTVIPVETGDVLAFKALVGTNQRTDETPYFGVQNGCTFEASNSVMSLMSMVPSDKSRNFYGLFQGCTGLLTAPELPETDLTRISYSFMFSGCTGLISAPELPATTLLSGCYRGMFSGCTGLSSAPELPATTLASACYSSMFSGCTGLTSAPELPATTLADWCYSEMFYGCTGLTSAPELPATTLASYCYQNMFSGCTGLTSAPDLPAILMMEYCYTSMFFGCTSLIEVPDELPATTLANYCYSNMFYGCTSLTSAPELPARTLAPSCYHQMFLGCSSLTEAPVLPATTLATKCYSYMFSGCSGLSDAPELSVITLAEECYSYMFSGCTGLASAPELPATTLASGCYQYMFQGCTGFSEAPELPATTLAASCYYGMFSGCTGLTSAPELHATTLAASCYYYMFRYCTSLTAAPALPATTLAGSCYYGMFEGCTSLTAAPALPATTLAGSCYSSMFSRCTSLTAAPVLPATTLADYCYRYMFYQCRNLVSVPSSLPAQVMKVNCYASMFEECVSLRKAPFLGSSQLAVGCYMDMFKTCNLLNEVQEILPATELKESCYSGMFYHCMALRTAPTLPANELVSKCYYQMFFYVQINSIVCLATDISATDCVRNWFYDYYSSGTFYKHPDMQDWPRGKNGVPGGMTIVDATL